MTETADGDLIDIEEMANRFDNFMGESAEAALIGVLANPDEGLVGIACSGFLATSLATAEVNENFIILLREGMGIRRDANGRETSKFFRPNSLEIFPTGSQATWTSTTATSASAYLLAPNLLENVAALLGVDHRLRPLEGAIDADLVYVLNRWEARSADEDNPALRCETERLSLIAAYQALTRFGVQPIGNRRNPVALSPSEVDRLAAFIDDQLQLSPSLAELAETVDRGVSDFINVFRKAFGAAPHQYIMRRRIERALEMLAAPAPPLVELALSLGFSSQAHFTNAFGKIVGVSPGRYRAEQAR